MNLTIKETINALDAVKAEIAELKKRQADYESHLYSFVNTHVESVLSDADYGCGTVNVEIDGYEVKTEVSKKISYDQKGLAEIHNRIVASGQDPKDYLKIKYDVSESAFGKWPKNVRAPFEPYRTVEPSKPKLSYKKLGD